MKPTLPMGPRGLSGEPRFWLAAAVLAGALSVMKGVRRPNLWAATSLQLDYSEGFIKRGLLGEALLRLHLPVGRLLFVQAVSAVVALLLAGAVITLVWRGVRRDGRFAVASALFASSVAPGYIAHLLGYPDLLLAGVATVLVLIRPGRWRFAGVAAGSIVAILAHEEYLLLFLPVAVLPDMLRAMRKPGAGAVSAARSLWPAILTLGLGAATALAVSAVAPLSPERMARLLHRQQAHADFPLRTDEFDVLLRSAGDNVAATFRYPFWGDNLAGALMFGPSAAVLMIWAWRELADTPVGWRRGLARAMTLGAVLAPLAMHLVGWDHFRWDAWALFDAFLALYIVQRGRAPPAPAPAGRLLSDRGRAGVLLLMLLNMGSGGGFMDARTPRLFPYTEWWTGWPRPVAASAADNSTDDDDQKPATPADAAPPQASPAPAQRP